MDRHYLTPHYYKALVVKTIVVVEMNVKNSIQTNKKQKWAHQVTIEDVVSP